MSVVEIVNAINDWPWALKIIFLCLSVAIEYIFPIFPGDTVVVLAGFLHAKGAFDLKEIFVAIIIGSLIGSFLAYQAGRYISSHPHFSFVKRIQSSKSFVAFNHWYARFGSIFLLLNRFFPGIRALFFVSAGMTHLPLLKVLLLGGLSAIIYNLFLVFLGQWLGFNADLIIDYLYKYSIAFYILLFFIVSLVLIYKWQKKRPRGDGD